MYKVAVVGDYDSIYGFAALGLETFPVSDVNETEKVFLELASGSYAVIYITEAAAAGIETAIVCRFRDRHRPLPGTAVSVRDPDSGYFREYGKGRGVGQAFGGTGSWIGYSVWRCMIERWVKPSNEQRNDKEGSRTAGYRQRDAGCQYV